MIYIIIFLLILIACCSYQTHRTMREAWDELKHETEASGRIHIGLAQKLLDDIHRTVKEFREQQRDIRKKVKGFQ